MLVQVQSSLSLGQYSRGVKIRLYFKACFITGCGCSNGIGCESLGCARNKLHFISIGGSAMTAIYIFLSHRNELWVISMGVVNVL